MQAAKCPVQFRWPRFCGQVATDPPFPVFFLTAWHALPCCAALHECGAAPSEVEGVVGAVRRKKDGTLLHRENKTMGKKRTRKDIPSRLTERGRQGSGCLQAPEAKTRWCRPSRPNMQALVAAAADTRSQAVPQPFVPHAGHLTRRDAPRDRCLESDIHGRSRNMQLVPASHEQSVHDLQLLGVLAEGGVCV